MSIRRRRCAVTPWMPRRGPSRGRRGHVYVSGGGAPREPDNLTVIHSKLIKHLQMCHGDGGESSIHQRPPSPRRNLAASQSNYANEGGTARDGGRWRGGAVRGESDTLACAPPKRRKQILIHYVAGGKVFLRRADRSRGQEVELAPHVELS